MYITYKKDTLQVTGCSSSIPDGEPFIEYSNEEWLAVEDEFLPNFECFVVDLATNKIVFEKELLIKKELIRKNRLTETQMLAQENSQLQIEIIMLKQQIGLYNPLPYKLINNNTNTKEYWYDRLEKKYASQEQIDTLIELGVI